MSIEEFIKNAAQAVGEAAHEVFGIKHNIVVVAVKKTLRKGSKAVFGTNGLSEEKMAIILGNITMELTGGGNEKYLDTLTDALGRSDGQSIEEIKDELRSDGVDVDDAISRLKMARENIAMAAKRTALDAAELTGGGNEKTDMQK